MLDITPSNWQSLMPALSKQVIREHYARNFDFVLSYIADDISWIGPLEAQYTVGKAVFTEKLTPEQDTPVVVSEDEYYIAASDDSFCTVVGTYVASTSSETEMLLMVRQRVTLQWIWRDDRPQIIHIHLSNPWEQVEENEPFPYQAARRAYEYIKQLHAAEEQIIRFRTVDNETAFVESDEILYIEAESTHCVLHLMNRKITVNNKISELVGRLPKRFCQIHRSYLVNVDYVVKISRYVVTLCDNIVLPVPEKRYQAVKREILRYKDEGK